MLRQRLLKVQTLRDIYMKSLFMRSLSALIVMTCSSFSLAEDIDLFIGNPSVGEASASNVLLVVDNTANWGSGNNPQPFTNLMSALRNVIAALPEDKFRVGIMFYNETGSPNNNVSGGYVRAALRLMTAENKAAYVNLVSSIHNNDDKGNGAIGSLVMAEAYRYMAGIAPHAGNNKVKTDYSANTYQGTTPAARAIYALPGNALDAIDATRYNSPVVSGCQKNYIIYLSNGPSTDNNSVRTEANSQLRSFGGDSAIQPIPISPSGLQDNPIDEWARFMKKTSPLEITTFTVEIDPGTSGQGPNWTAVMKSVAKVSEGEYFAVNSGVGGGQQIVDTLKGIFSQIQSVNSVFASVSLPVSVNTQGTYLNQVYIGMFRPDSQSRPLWAGNLKQYKLGYDNNVLKLLDANSNSAINSSTGFIDECVRSFWTPTSTDNYWAFRPQSSCLTIPGAANSNYPDGNIVEKGAQAYKLRQLSGPGSRTIKTCATDSCTALVELNSTNVTATRTGGGTDHAAIINFARGQDVRDENAIVVDGYTANTAELRPSVHGDVVHSRPVAINYGSNVAGSRQVALFYGGNDGLLHAVNGNRDDLGDGAIGSGIAARQPGQELWAFMPPEFHPKMKRLYDNSPKISFPGIPDQTPVPTPKGYGMDGPIVAYKNGNTATVFASLRRGGRRIYAFNVNDPLSPSLLWWRGCSTADDTSCSVDGTLSWSGIGQTWSAPKVVTAQGYASGPLLVMGAGYDVCEDTDTGASGATHSCTSASKGKHIYVVDASSGTLLKSFPTLRGVSADLTVVPDASGNIKYAYAADLGGNVYRISGADANSPIGATAPANWTITQIASLGCDTDTASCSRNRKFMFAPSVVEDGATYHVMLGSGDREKPLDYYGATTSVSNYFFALKDQPTNADWLADSGCTGSLMCLASLQPVSGSTTPTDTELAATKGWYLALRSHEQVVTSAVTVFDVLTFSTHIPTQPNSGACTTLGTASVYNINYRNAKSENGLGQRYETIVGGGLPPSPVAGMVTLDDGSTVPFLIGGSGSSPLEGGEPPLPDSAKQPKARVYWNIEQ
jgi:type IV pilus assembly protein PilY1